MIVWKPWQCVTCDNVWWPDERPRHAENAAAKVAAPHTIHIWTASQANVAGHPANSGKTMSSCRSAHRWAPAASWCCFLQWPWAWTSHAQASQTTLGGEWHQINPYLCLCERGLISRNSRSVLGGKPSHYLTNRQVNSAFCFQWDGKGVSAFRLSSNG